MKETIQIAFVTYWRLGYSGKGLDGVRSLLRGIWIVYNLYMEDFERWVLESVAHPPCWWKQYVDNTHTVLLKTHTQEFTDHLNNINDDIKWTTEWKSRHTQ